MQTGLLRANNKSSSRAGAANKTLESETVELWADKAFVAFCKIESQKQELLHNLEVMTEEITDQGGDVNKTFEQERGG